MGHWLDKYESFWSPNDLSLVTVNGTLTILHTGHKNGVKLGNDHNYVQLG